MISKKTFSKLALLLVSATALSVGLSIGHQSSKVESKTSHIVIDEPSQKGVVQFVSGTTTSSDITPLSCVGTTKHTLYGKFFNTTDRIVGLKSQDTVFTLSQGGTDYNVKPFDDECVSYVAKKEYLRPGESTKGYFVIVDNAKSASNAVINANSNIVINFQTNVVTDTKVKERLGIQTRTIAETDSPEVETKPAFVVEGPTPTSQNTGEKIALGGLIFLALCPIALFVGMRVYKVKKEKRTKKN